MSLLPPISSSASRLGLNFFCLNGGEEALALAPPLVVSTADVAFHLAGLMTGMKLFPHHIPDVHSRDIYPPSNFRHGWTQGGVGGLQPPAPMNPMEPPLTIFNLE